MMNLNYFTIALLAILVISSCNKDESPSPNPTTKGNISGSVFLYDEGTTHTDNSNMAVTAKGATLEISAVTDANGKFSILEVPFGTYTMVFEKAGYGTYKNFNIEHTTNSTAITNIPSLGKVSTTQITKLEATVNGNTVILSVTTNPAGSNGNTRYIRYFLSSNSNVGIENYIYFSPAWVSQINPKEITLSSNDLSSIGFPSGSTVFVRVYGDSFWSNQYDDPVLGKMIFPNLNLLSANPVSFVVP